MCVAVKAAAGALPGLIQIMGYNGEFASVALVLSRLGRFSPFLISICPQGAHT